MSFKDIFEESFINGFSSEIDIKEIAICLLLSCLTGFYIFLIYRIFSRKTFYSKNFNISLVFVALITSAIILTIQSNIVMSLGMVGALSIVRFRTAVKDPMDLAFLYWAISAGIICGAGLMTIVVMLCIILTLVFFLLNKYPVIKKSMVLVINANDIAAEEAITELLKKHVKNYIVKSKSCRENKLEMIIELNVKQDSSIVKEICAIDGVTYASLVMHDGEVTAQ